MTEGSHDPIDVIGKIPFHFICVFWCAFLELSPEKDGTHKKLDLGGDDGSPLSLLAKSGNGHFFLHQSCTNCCLFYLCCFLFFFDKIPYYGL